MTGRTKNTKEEDNNFQEDEAKDEDHGVRDNEDDEEENGEEEDAGTGRSIWQTLSPTQNRERARF